MEAKLKEYLEVVTQACRSSDEYGAAGPRQRERMLRRAQVAAFRRFIDEERQRLWAWYQEEPSGARFCQEHTRLFDVVVKAMYELALTTVRERQRTWGEVEEAELCVAAVGGYGRGQLGPYSDIDVVFIPAREEHPFVDAVVRETFNLLTETLVPRKHPQMAHSYRPFSDIGLMDHRTLTSLLESRYLCGSEHLYQHFMQELMRHIDPIEFLYQNLREREQAWAAEGSSLYRLEPDLKNGPGGLRDFHTAVWVAKVTYRIAVWDVLEELQRQGIIAGTERNRVLNAVEFVLRMRNWLQIEKGHKADVLEAAKQDPLAQVLGYRRDGEVAPEEQLMRDYFVSARAIANFSRRLLRKCQQERLSSPEGFVVVKDTLYPAHEGIFRDDPVRLLQVFELAQKYWLTFSLELEDLIRQNVDLINHGFRHSQAAALSFLNILRSPHEVAGTLRAMLDLGVLEAYLPEFGQLLPLIPPDPVHEYAVGEHSLRVVEAIQAVRDGSAPEEDSLRFALSRIPQPEVLYLAALLHDAGKMESPEGPHPAAGALVARRVAERLGLDEGTAGQVEWLVRFHLEMMEVARTLDLSLPETIHRFCRDIPTVELLDALYLLSYTDAQCVGRGVLRDMDKQLLAQLYTAARRELEEQVRVEVPWERLWEERARRAQRDVKRSLRDFPPEVVEEHLQAMPPWYALNTRPSVIAKHISYIQRLPAEKAVIDFYQERDARFTELTVCTYDRIGLLRDIAGTLAANSINITVFQLNVRQDVKPIFISTIWIDDYGQPVGETKQYHLVDDLRRVLVEGVPVPEVFAQHEKALPNKIVLHAVTVHNDLSPRHTILRLRAEDQLGLLYLFTRALAAEGLDIRAARVTTWHGEAEDTFYVTDAEGNKLSDEDCTALVEQLRARLT
ncbi:MAG TPA: HD domain-containing protein [Armatimonadetes bacterium]|nr:HD domain-containing protein [Armatimonadota bacterium]